MNFQPIDLIIAEWFFDTQGATVAMHYLFEMLAALDREEEECLCEQGCGVHQ